MPLLDQVAPALGKKSRDKMHDYGETQSHEKYR